ncbi:MAG TPA: flagellar basal body rod protein FlgB [Ghiorsea sp.]|nr:flagellar basal body rod protein FlgB [Ghiorsea sp.]HIP06687.1 flagellar basal body rod protein FlgB [Mariprofundaceae bacterium]
MSGLFSNSFMKLGAAAAAREQMQTVISSNIANADTPNYRADKRTFEDFYKERVFASSSVSPQQTNANHLQGSSSQGLSMNLFNRSDDAQRMDGNTVNVEREMSNLAENQLMYELNMKILQGKLSSITNAIKEGGR